MRAQKQVEETLFGWVRRARHLGAPWAQMGQPFGLTRQSAWERFAPDDSAPGLPGSPGLEYSPGAPHQ